MTAIRLPITHMIPEQRRCSACGDGSEFVARMPFFEKRTIETQVTISDGSTVVMGGLVDERTETFSDQVPLFGDSALCGSILPFRRNP